ncbi:hypothetical protein [Salibacterium halotolerans]|uniref:Uncharacterized protein n=1 Tax=Salibacterium halotolerans TaxID=1884432 RepID=A0A1I5N7K2_9BACI|nr:hypothetical protein [Salibacterium halotolerans]SFP17829.1 hypothetical protein SAMN05518683_10329 [Salibacterium halotolerans]
MLQSAIYLRGRNTPPELWEQRKAQLMEIYRENERLLSDMERNGQTSPGTILRQTAEV